MEVRAEDYGPTRLRAVLLALLDLQEGGGLELEEWEAHLAQMLQTQSRYCEHERRALFRLVLKYHRTGALERAAAKRREANSDTNHARAVRCCENHSNAHNGASGDFPCPICNTGERIYYHSSRKGRLTAVCRNVNCLRLYQDVELLAERIPRFVNILPHDIGTYLVESETEGADFYSVDVVEQTCTCNDYRYRDDHSGEYQCKHLSEVNHAVFILRAF